MIVQMSEFEDPCVESSSGILEEWKESDSQWVRLENKSIRNIHEFLNHLHIYNKVLEQKFSLSHHRGLEELDTSAQNFASPLNINIFQVNNIPVNMTEHFIVTKKFSARSNNLHINKSLSKHVDIPAKESFVGNLSNHNFNAKSVLEQ